MNTSSKLTIIIAAFLSLLLISSGCREPEPSAPLQEALEAASWITSSAVPKEQGTAWPAVPGEEDSVDTTLYSGMPGVVLFFLEAAAATGDSAYLDKARSGADYLISILDGVDQAGLYTGLAGLGFIFHEIYKATVEEKYREAFQECLRRIEEKAVSRRNGLDWGPTTDIISGSAGTGLFLLYAAHELNESYWQDMAARAGRRLVELGIPTEEGTKWAMDPQYPSLMPNFSHGTAGIAYFLASLYQVTGDMAFLESASSGARYLLSVARTEDDICLIFHHEPEGEDLFYLGWCHGPVGTTRLFYRLYEITEDPAWMDWVERGAAALIQSGIPEKETPGFWNNVGICCGSSGVAEFFLNLHRLTGKEEYLRFARRLTDQILAKGIHGDSGLSWPQAEHRTRPDFLQAQTGLMQGAAGIGLWLLHLHLYERGQTAQIKLPDNPF
jgi:lantibiotic modifying enzyme